MGKKRVVQKTEKELLAETDKVAKKLKQQEAGLKTSGTLSRGKVYISSTYNNTIISLTNHKGDVLRWATAGNIGFKGTKKGTAFAGGKVAEAIADVCLRLKIKNLDIFVKGVGSGRDSALKVFSAKGLEIESVKDITPIPHNGCRSKKPRRV
ncbi:30S ribosomal protein S11 [Candidatus Gribaldobacteria bacterium]|nr:30S ribosomal protein S11 [Candidatus Gribaldobacteria bacterium]